MAKRIPLFRMPKSETTELLVLRALRGGWWSSGGAQVKQLEQEFADYLGVQYVIAVNSGTAACRAALFGALKGNLPNPAPVITTTYSCAANLTPLMEFRCQPIFVDIDPASYGPSLDAIQRLPGVPMAARAAIIPYIYGEPPAQVTDLVHTLKNNDVVVICDLSEAVGMSSDLFLGDIFVASLRSEKMVGAGEGGIVATNNEEFYQRMLAFCNRGKTSSVHYWYGTYGDNLLMPHLTAALAVGQLETLKVMVKGKRRVAELYRNDQYLSKIIEWQTVTEPGVSWLNCGTLKYDSIITTDLITALKSAGIECRPAFYPLPVYWNTVMNDEIPREQWEVARHLCRNGIIFPSPYDLSDEEFTRIVNTTEHILQSIKL